MGETKYSLYSDIQNRTNGEIYLGVVGPVRTGKSTFIKQFMEQMVLPNMTDEHSRMRTVDELPQSAQGRTIMTTEPKFVPKEHVEIRLENDLMCKVRLIDCVGFLIQGATGYMEGDKERMVKTPWYDYEIPFAKAAAIGTEKVIRDHATIGIVVTCDGTFGELDREAYTAAEEETIGALKQIHKPYVVVLNTGYPGSKETLALAKEMEQKYGCSVVPINCQQMGRKDIDELMKRVLYEFPISGIHYSIPKWVEMLDAENEIKQSVAAYAKTILENTNKVRDIYDIDFDTEENYVSKTELSNVDLSTGVVEMTIDLEDKYYYENLSRLAGIPIDGEYQLLAFVQKLSALRHSYEKVAGAMEAVEQKGYGVVTPGLSDITMEEPVLIRHGNKFGVKMKALSPSIHMIRANIETEIAPIVGSEQQALDLISYIKEGQKTKDGVFETNIFGKSIGELMEDGMRSKIAMMDDECQMKLQDTMQKIVNDNNGGLICLII
ncbi:MAG: stage IV sporulation protein A [Lachnospiraceae bacterium]|nr:stage IV sporulation protein A [Lachnospiraceae bacterium]MDD6192581.1 stage IV sporulation protein A [Lachnospiraceae bacterium]MDY4793846.1 stage IV sporulation protein A [Pararoseburia sp.]